uniref:Calmodulin-lysine N-methyltransferase n=1 Tax=Proboscia inermis TaxID=420281 RepID=A0A7S0CHL5_9STRA|mmetsp:Transcript_29162/g.33586  ORF Transcript_29162/g.33586 Transcript_29162/m.33586 type:complete len:214 (+) Transcript_29162:118-759(+)|eukprot:CAMPEP_0171313738 /NCGR_PEP_ID=MMETSP0816-20121228/45092_1 /TAXON_ID=420281 /ORGANISM="Proboscia inermis, Strain CCAP1064/1" /LENGTH=213 /DNA_ID=CAMNT_0011801571 /DNA_START=116 /DNA_END=757 /DNA_ORIENTATION=-
MAKYFSDQSSCVQKQFLTKRTAIELGSGNGFLSVCLLAALINRDGEFDETQKSDHNNMFKNYVGLNRLVITDFSDHLPLIEKTLEANPSIIEDAKARNMDIEVVKHEWGIFPTCGDDDESRNVLCRDETFDFIFGSDLAYRSTLHEPLIKSLKRFSHDKTVILIGITMNDTPSSFFDKLSDAGFSYERLNDCLMDPKFRGQTFGLFAVQKKKH